MLSTRNIDELAFLYVVLNGIVLHLFPYAFPELLAAFLMLPSVLIIPYLFGKSLIRFCKPILKNFLSSVTSNEMTCFIFSWVLGAHIVGAVAGLLTYLQLSLLVKNLALIILIIIGVFLVYDRWRNVSIKQVPQNTIKICLLMIAIIPIVFTPVAIIKSFQPFPNAIFSNTHMDPVISVQPAYRMIESGYLAPEIRWSDVIFPYFSLYIFDVEPLHFLWCAPFILTLTFAFGIFLLSYVMSRKIEIGLLSAFFGVFLNVNVGWPGQFILHFKDGQLLYAIFPLVLLSIYKVSNGYKENLTTVFKTLLFSFVSLGAIFFFVQRLKILYDTPDWALYNEFVIHPFLMIFLPLLGLILSFVIKIKPQKNLFLLLFFYSTVFFLWHPEESLLFTFAMFAFAFFCTLVKHRERQPLIWLLAIGSFFFVYLQWIGILSFPNISISSLWNPSIVQSSIENVFQNQQIGYSFANRELIQILTVIGGLFALTSRKKGHLLMVGMLSVTLFVFFFPEFWMSRGYKQFSPFLAYVVAFAIYSIYCVLNEFPIPKRYVKSPKLFSIFMTGLLFVAIIPSLPDPIYESGSRWSSPEYIADYEYTAANWVRDNLSETSVLLSDYTTMLILSSLGNKIWITGKAMSAQTLGSNISQQAMQTIKFGVFAAESSLASYSAVKNLSFMFHIQEKNYLEYKGLDAEDLSFFVVLSSRTVAWIEQDGIDDVIASKHSDVPMRYFDFFNDDAYFEQIYQINNVIYIFKVNI